MNYKSFLNKMKELGRQVINWIKHQAMRLPISKMDKKDKRKDIIQFCILLVIFLMIVEVIKMLKI